MVDTSTFKKAKGNAVHNKHPHQTEPALYVVATPIGNLRDITLRALETLTAVDVIAAEDTRNTAHLLTHHGITARRLLALHQHNERGAAEKIITLLEQGQSVALVTDAGTPAVSDPGALLVEAVRAAGHRVIPLPGANAAVAALSASGLSAPHFLFYGFLPNKSAARRRELETLVSLPCTLAFYEAPHRVVECVEDLLAVLGGEREIVFARELTKLFETLHRCSLTDAPAWLAANENNRRGEFVLLVSGAVENKDDTETLRVLTELLQELPLKQAVQLASRITGANRNAVYEMALATRRGE
jgi:16S rRNA (cytidine1402-2'-O)-methyltransferase